MATVVRRTCEQCGRGRAERFYTSPKGRVCQTCRTKTRSNSSRGQRLWDTYGLTLDQYDQIVKTQGGGCGICGRTPKYNMDVDHDHQVEKALLTEGLTTTVAKYMSIRGVLCKVCNRRLLPAARDSVLTLRKAIDYLMDSPADQVLVPPVRAVL